MNTKREKVKGLRLSGRDLENVEYLSQVWREDEAQAIRRAVEICVQLEKKNRRNYKSGTRS